jgi:hypothetical protein
MVTKEEWREALYWEGLYEVSNMGRVRNIQRWVKSKSTGRKFLPVVVRKLQLNRYGYPVACLNGKAKVVLKSVHRMVVETFIGPIPDGMQVNHMDGNKENNHLDNLEVCTGSQNQLHRHRVLGQHQGEHHPLSKLKERDIHLLRTMYADGFTQQQIADNFGVDRTCISLIVRGKNWSWLKTPEGWTPASA